MIIWLIIFHTLDRWSFVFLLLVVRPYKGVHGTLRKETLSFFCPSSFWYWAIISQQGIGGRRGGGGICRQSSCRWWLDRSSTLARMEACCCFCSSTTFLWINNIFCSLTKLAACIKAFWWLQTTKSDRLLTFIIIGVMFSAVTLLFQGFTAGRIRQTWVFAVAHLEKVCNKKIYIWMFRNTL